MPLLLKDIKVTMNDNYPHYLEYKKQRYSLYSYAKISYKATDFLSSSKKFPDTKAIHYFWKKRWMNEPTEKQGRISDNETLQIYKRIIFIWWSFDRIDLLKNKTLITNKFLFDGHLIEKPFWKLKHW